MGIFSRARFRKADFEYDLRNPERFERRQKEFEDLNRQALARVDAAAAPDLADMEQRRDVALTLWRLNKPLCRVSMPKPSDNPLDYADNEQRAFVEIRDDIRSELARLAGRHPDDLSSTERAQYGRILCAVGLREATDLFTPDEDGEDEINGPPS